MTTKSLVLAIPERAAIDNSFQLLEVCGQADRSAESVVLDSSGTVYFDSFGVALLAATIAYRRELSRATTLTLPKAPGAKHLLREVAIDGFVRGEDPKPGTLELRQLRALDALYTNNVADLLVRGVPGITEHNVYPIQLCLNELLQNVFEWAESPIGCTVLTRWYRASASVHLAVVDRGIGLPAALRRKQIDGLHRRKDADVIKAAVMTPRLTSRSNKVGGLGLKTIREVVCDHGGRLTILSLGAKVTWQTGKPTKANEIPGFRGTAVEIELRPSTSPDETDTNLDVF